MNKTVAILVGGKGTRLQSVVSSVPKPLAPIAGEPFLFLILRQLKKYGFSRVVLLTGYMHDMIHSACGDGKQFGLEIVYSEERDPLGTAGALLKAKSFLESEKEFILMNGDTYLDCDLEKYFEAPLIEKEIALIGAVEVKEKDRFGSLLIDKKTGHIKKFLEKASDKRGYCSYPRGRSMSFLLDFGLYLQRRYDRWVEKRRTQQMKGWVNAGIYKLSTDIFKKIPENKFCSLEQDVFPQLLKEKSILKAYPLQGNFIDIGIPETYLSFNETQSRGVKQCD